MLKEEIVSKFLEANKVPSKYTIKEVLGYSSQTLVRRGFIMSDIIAEYKKLVYNPKLCLCCEGVIAGYGNKFCSRSCSAKYNNPVRIRTRTNNSNRVISERTSQPEQKDVVKIDTLNYCRNCNNLLQNKKAKYCNTICQQRFEQDSFIEKWLNGDDVCANKGNCVSTRIRRYLFEIHDCKCSKCGWCEVNPVTGKVPLEVEHINGDSTDNSPSNLTLLCPNCHSLTPTFRALNKGNGRYSRRIRYREGKSF